MKKFLIISNQQRDPHGQVTIQLEKYIRYRGEEPIVIPCTQANWMTPEIYRKIQEIGADFCFVLGGDGTLVRSARELADFAFPIIGVNLGNLGYLCELDRTNLAEAVDRVLSGNYSVEDRMMIRSYCDDDETKGFKAFNDIVIHQMGDMKVVKLILSVNGEYLNTYTADGIIVSTPTGSTGYSMSAGGPIVDPKSRLIVITPINSHDLNSRSIVIGSDSNIEITLVPRRPERDEIVEVVYDGDRYRELAVGEKIHITAAQEPVHILKLDRTSFLQILRKKLHS